MVLAPTDRGRKKTGAEGHLMYVLAEGWNSGELADEVEVGSSEGVDSAAVISGQRLICTQSQILHRSTE